METIVTTDEKEKGHPIIDIDRIKYERGILRQFIERCDDRQEHTKVDYISPRKIEILCLLCNISPDKTKKAEESNDRRDEDIEKQVVACTSDKTLNELGNELGFEEVTDVETRI